MVKSIFYTSTYDANHNVLTSISQSWSAGAWVNTGYNISTYNASNKKILMLKKYWNSITSTWKDNSRITFTYDINNNNIYTLEEKWTTVWNNYTQTNYTYDTNHNQLSIIDQYWSGVWTNTNKHLYVYDASNNMLSALAQNWKSSTSVFINSAKETHTYDINNIIKSVEIKSFDITNGINITQGDSFAYYYHTVVGINELPLSQNLLTIMPNPSNGKMVLNTDTEISLIEVYNNLGTLVAKPEIIKKEINLSYLPAGIYFLKVYSQKEFKISKIIIE